MLTSQVLGPSVIKIWSEHIATVLHYYDDDSGSLVSLNRKSGSADFDNVIFDVYKYHFSRHSQLFITVFALSVSASGAVV